MKISSIGSSATARTVTVLIVVSGVVALIGGVAFRQASNHNGSFVEWHVVDDAAELSDQQRGQRTSPLSINQTLQSPPRDPMYRTVAYKMDTPTVDSALAGETRASFSNHVAVVDINLSLLPTGSPLSLISDISEPAAERWTVETAGAERFISFQNTFHQSLLYDNGLKHREVFDVARRDDPRFSFADLAFQTLTSESFDLINVNNGALESQGPLDQTIDSAEPVEKHAEDETGAASASAAPSTESETQLKFDEALVQSDLHALVNDDALAGVGYSTLGSSKGRVPGSRTQNVPEPVTMPILLGGLVLFVRTRRRREEISLVRQIIEDGFSFKVPPGNADRTSAQLL